MVLLRLYRWMDFGEERPKTRYWPFILVFLVMLVVGAFLIEVPLHALHAHKPAASPSACVNNLMQIDGAKEQWALENKKPAGSPVTTADILEINKYIKGGAPAPCPNGGIYSYNALDSKPTCTIPGHTI